MKRPPAKFIQLMEGLNHRNLQTLTVAAIGGSVVLVGIAMLVLQGLG